MVPGCTNCSKKTRGSDVLYHRLPNEQQLRKTGGFDATTCRKQIHAMFVAHILPPNVSKALLRSYLA